MANKKITYTLELDAEISSLESKLKGARTALDGVLKSGNAPAGLKKTLESLEDMLGRIRDKASTPIEAIGDANKIKRDISSVMQGMNGLVRIIDELHSLSGDERFRLLPPDVQQQLIAAANGVRTFNDAIAAATTETGELKRAREELAAATSSLSAKEADLASKQASLKGKRDRRDEIQAEIDAINERKKALEEAKKEQAEVDAFYAEPDENDKKKDRRRKYEGVSATPAQAKAKTDALASQVEADKRALEELSAELRIVKNDIKSYEGQVATAGRNAEAARIEQGRLTQAVEQLNNAFQSDSTEKQQAAFEALKEEAVKAGLSLEDIADSYTAEDAQKLTNALLQLKNKAMDGVTDSTGDAKRAVEDFGSATEAASNKVDEATESIEKQNDAIREQEAFENKIKQFLGLSGAAQVMRAALRDAMQTITELDATMTEMAVVTDLTVGDYWDQLPEYSKQASDLGVSINSAYKAATLYYQQGLKGNEVTKISAETLKMAKIAGLDAADATNKMTAALRGFNMELNETSAKRVSDVYSELAAITAADVDEISNAMTKTASIASSAGMEFETTAAFLSQIIETTRESAETAGTALKTVIARFQELKKDPSEIGEVDGEIVDANKIETALRSVGVALRDSSGQFRDLDDVFMDLSKKWDGLDKNTQRYIATIAAGSRQQSRFIAMMSDYGRTQELVTAANNSAGASNKQFEKTMDSLEAKIEKLKNAWHEFTMGILESDLVKFGVDVLTKFLEIVNKATSSIDGIGGSLTKIISIVGIFKLASQIFGKIKQPLISFFAEVVKMSREEGEKSGQAFKEGAKKGASNKKEGVQKTKVPLGVRLPKGYKIDEEGRMHDPSGKFVSKEESEKVIRDSTPSVAKRALNIASDKTGITDFMNARETNKAAKTNLQNAKQAQDQAFQKRETATEQWGQAGGRRRAAEDQLAVAQAEHDKLAKQYSEDSLEMIKADQKVADAQKEVNQATQDYATARDNMKQAEVEFDAATQTTADAQKAKLEAGYQASEQVAAGLQKAGAAATGLGMAFSLVGGALQAAGLEEAGETLSTIGNWAMIAGSAISALGPIVTAVGNIAKVQGISTMAAWGWVLLIVAGIALLVGGIIAIFAQINNNSPEKKLEKAQKAAEGAAKGAEAAAEAYANLSDSLDDLSSKYDALDELRRGTEEWNKAVQETNSSVLDLIEKYPELAGLVENEGGVLTLDVESDEVQDVMNSYKEDSVRAQGAALGAKAQLARAEADYELNKMDDSVFEKFQTDGQGEAVAAAFGNMLAAGVVGAGSGAAIGAGIGGIAGTAMPGIGNLVGAGAGAAWGAIIGGTTGLAAGIAGFQYTVDQMEKNNEQNRKNVEELAQAYANGETGTTVEDVTAYIERNGIAVGDAAKEMAESLISEADTMKEFGDTLNTRDAKEKAYYDAMATNAQQLIDLGKYNEHQMNQMTTIVDEDLIKQYEENEKEKLKAEAENKDGDFDKQKEEFAKSVHGENAKVEGNKIVDLNGEVLQEFSDDEDWINQMAASNATLKAAEAMEQIPDILNKSLKSFDQGLHDSITKAFEGKDLTKAEVEEVKTAMGGAIYYDDEGKSYNSLDDAWNALDANAQAIWGSKEAYGKSLDVDYTKIDAAWKDLSDEQKAAYGYDPSVQDSEDKAKEQYEKTWTDIVDAQVKAFEKAESTAAKLGITLSDKLSSEAAQAWTLGLESVSLGATEGELGDLNDSLAPLLEGLEQEQIDLVMAEINAMDKMDIDSWNNLSDVFADLNIDVNAAALERFAQAGIKAYNAIDKIDFETFADDINNTYKLLDKVKEGGRTYSESDYKELIAGNARLVDAFMQVGDEFIYMGGSMQDLTEALEENTLAKMQEANRQLKSRSAMSGIIQDKKDGYGSVDAMDDYELMTYLTDMRAAFVEQGLDIADFGIAGLSGTTDLSKATTEQLKSWASSIALEGGKQSVYENEYAEGVKRANILRYSYNDASYNAEMAAGGNEYADEHQEALILQAIQSGAVSNATIEAYKQAIEDGNEEAIREIGADIAESTERIVEDSEGRNVYKDLIDRVTAAIENARQKEIDKLSELNDTFWSTNDKLIQKIQAQIDADRQARENEKTESNITDLRTQQSYLGMDTSGTNILQQQELESQITEAEQSYQDTLVDQAIQNLSDANAEAAEQRQEQIDLLQSQLDWQIENGELTREAEEIVASSLESGVDILSTELGKLLWDSEGGGLGKLSEEDWVSDLQTSAAAALNWYALQGIKTENVSGDGGTGEKESGSAIDTGVQKQNNAIAAGRKALSSTRANNDAFDQAYKDYQAAGGTKDKAGFLEAINAGRSEDDKLTQSSNYILSVGKTNSDGNNWNWGDAFSGAAEEGGVTLNDETKIRLGVKDGNVTSVRDKVKNAVGGDGLPNGTVFKYNNGYYIWKTDGDGYALKVQDGVQNYNTLASKYKYFETGGMADFTGPAWLDGTKSRPEYVLNSDQTERFFSLVDVLEDFDSKDTSTSGGDNYYDISISVEKLENDYDVEQVANKIRRMIYEDASYRNVNAINLIR